MSRNKERRPLSELGRRRALRSWRSYLLVLTAWVTVVILLAFIGALVCDSITWQPNDRLYWALLWVRDYIVFVCLFMVLAGWVVISYFFISGPQRQIEELTAAAGQLASPSQEPISLSPVLADVEVQMNTVRETALRNARAAREAEQRKNDLVVYLAHDLKTPLTSVIGYLTLLHDEPDLSPQMRARYTGIALEKAERLEDLINEFFDITRFNLTQLELEKQPTDLTRMLQQVSSEFEPILAEAHLACHLDLPPKLMCPCDGEKLSRVFDNLLRNACYYSLPGTQVEIAGHLEDGQAIMTFTNAGKTIPQEKLQRIFEQFFRLDSSRASRTGGAGLGLAIAKEIVELHGGSISAASADDTVTFTIRLPAP